MVIDGFDVQSSILGSYFANVTNGTRLISSANELMILVNGEKHSQFPISFEIMLQMETTICGQVEYSLSGNQVSNFNRVPQISL